MEIISIHFIVIMYWLKLIIIIFHFQESYLDLDNAYTLVIISYHISSQGTCSLSVLGDGGLGELASDSAFVQDVALRFRESLIGLIESGIASFPQDACHC